jgi:hypothetical protein
MNDWVPTDQQDTIQTPNIYKWLDPKSYSTRPRDDYIKTATHMEKREFNL